MKPENKIKVHSLMSAVYKRQRDCLLVMLHKLTRDDHELSEDILHDAVIKLLLWGGQVHGFEHLSILLTKSVKQIWLNHYSRNIPKAKKIINACKSEERQIDPILTIDYYPYSKEIMKRVKSLSTRQQQVINTVFFEGMTSSEIGQIYNMKQPHISLHKKIALTKLKNKP